MELKEFISQTITQITEGIISGNKYLKKKKKQGEIDQGYMRVNFDIAVSVTEESQKDKGGKITVVNIFQAGVSKSDSAKTDFAREVIPALSKSYFEVFRPIFEFIKNKCHAIQSDKSMT